MTAYAIVVEGEVVGYRGRPDPADFIGPPEPMSPMPPGYDVHIVDEIIQFSSAPNESSVLKWINGAPQWTDPRTLDEAKSQAWERIKAARSDAELAPFECDGCFYDADGEATRRISGATNGAMMAAMAGAPFSVNFTLADNTSVNLTGEQMMAVGRALIEKVDSVFAKARAKREAIDSVTTQAEADAITWNSEE